MPDSLLNVVEWRHLFTHPDWAPIVLEKISRHLTDTGHWKLDPYIRTMPALYSVLLKRGYIIPLYTAEEVAYAFRQQFGRAQVASYFQEGQRSKERVVEKEQAFVNIPLASSLPHKTRT